MLKAKDLRDQSLEELEATLADSKKTLFERKNELRKSKKVDQPHLFKETKKAIAKILTIINEKRLAKA